MGLVDKYQELKERDEKGFDSSMDYDAFYFI
jgi:hypothetical protein